jgi:hypothetical protein
VSLQVSRRTFLLLVVGAGAGATAAWRLLEANGDSQNAVVAALLDDPAAARRVGEAYLERYPGEAGEERLTRLLGLADGQPPAVQQAQVGAAVRRDYQESRLALVEGWYLSRTEARLCALSTYG